MLNIVNSKEGWQRCQQHLQQDDAVIFIENGCFAASSFSGVATFMLVEHSMERSIDLPAGVEACDMVGFVKLITQHETSISW